MSLLFSGFKAAASPHVAGLICFLSLIFFFFFFNRADPLRLLFPQHLTASLEQATKAFFLEPAGGQGRATSKGMQSGSDVLVIVLPCASAPHCPEAALNRQAQRPPFKVGTTCSIRRPAFASALVPSSHIHRFPARGGELALKWAFFFSLSHSLSVSPSLFLSLLLSQNLRLYFEIAPDWQSSPLSSSTEQGRFTPGYRSAVGVLRFSCEVGASVGLFSPLRGREGTNPTPGTGGLRPAELNGNLEIDVPTSIF